MKNLSDPQGLLSELQALRMDVFEEGQTTYSRWCDRITQRGFTISALNLAYYLALRRRDLRPIQAALMPWGLSSLGRIESRVMPNIDAVLNTLGAVCGADQALLPSRPHLGLFFRGERLLKRQTRAVFGEPPQERRVRIMVTMPSEAARRYQLVLDLVQRGMDCIRINCAHDTPSDWEAMIGHLRRAEAETGRKCKVAMDLGGPKVRTGRVKIPEKGRLHIGDHLLLTPEGMEVPKEYPVYATCTLEVVFDRLKPGAKVWFDDGKLGAEVETLVPEGALLRITSAREKGERLQPEKGINFPATELNISPLTDQDYADLDFIACHADLINYSFAQTAADIGALQAELAKRLERPETIAIVAKIETPAAVRNLPEIIVQAGGKQPVGVMIARGDLAVELGYERLAEMQEEILWICEAAHVPVIWATQVLETLVKTGRPSRAEITDAAMSERAECVMLNKGEYITNAVSILDDVLKRMQAHQSKKTAQLRALRSW